jgi:hypothetical protein
MIVNRLVPYARGAAAIAGFLGTWRLLDRQDERPAGEKR